MASRFSDLAIRRPWSIIVARPDYLHQYTVFNCSVVKYFPNSAPAYMCMHLHMDRVKRIWYLSPMRAAKVQASLRIRAVSPELPLLARTSSESSGTFRQKARSLPPLNGLACAVKICHDGMLEDTNSLDGAHIIVSAWCYILKWNIFRKMMLIKETHLIK